VFGYGSLMWNPGFDYVESCPARLYGLHRHLCVWSTRYRGTPSRPGLVVGLDRGGSCIGMAFHVHRSAAEDTLHYLRHRELITGVYRPRFTKVVLCDGRRTRALAFVVHRVHPQYAGPVDVDTAARIVRESTGQSGPNTDYVANTVIHLRELGLHDDHLARVAALLGIDAGGDCPP
jgi:cation transport protein ChaC